MVIVGGLCILIKFMSVVKVFINVHIPFCMYAQYAISPEKCIYMSLSYPCGIRVSQKVNRKAQGVPQSQATANPWHQEEQKKDRN